MASPADILVQDHGSVVLFHPATQEGWKWLVENVEEEAQWFGQALVVEHRYAGSLIEGMAEWGLGVSH